MKKSFLLLLIVIVFISGCVGDKVLNVKLNAIVSELNKKCPMPVDVATVLVNAEALPNGVLKYNYKLKAAVDLFDTITAQRVFRRKIMYNLRNNPDLKALTDMELTFLYDYSDMGGKHLLQVNVAPDEYKHRNGKGYVSNQNLAILIPDMAWNNRLFLPLSLDQYTVWTDSQFAAPDTMVMAYDVDDSQIDMKNFSVSMLKETLVKSTKSDRSSQELKDKGCIFKHVYHLGKGNDFQIAITPADYK